MFSARGEIILWPFEPVELRTSAAPYTESPGAGWMMLIRTAGGPNRGPRLIDVALTRLGGSPRGLAR